MQNSSRLEIETFKDSQLKSHFFPKDHFYWLLISTKRPFAAGCGLSGGSIGGHFVEILLCDRLKASYASQRDTRSFS